MLWVKSVNKDRKFVELGIEDEPIHLKGVEVEELGKLDLEEYITPGTRVNTKVLKVLSNGLLVKFLKVFYGYVFIDHLTKPL